MIVINITKIRYNYHIFMLDLNNFLNRIGLRSDEKADLINIKHALTLFGDILPNFLFEMEKDALRDNPLVLFEEES